jgi:hypothetical protein
VLVERDGGFPVPGWSNAKVVSAAPWVKPTRKIEPIASMPDDEVIAAIAPNLQRYVNGDLAAVRRKAESRR